ncbi:MAG: NAD-binding protein [Gammaproteobacteria bacterium]|nr:NAD-binding protein [Gammaproteobacteria bacterium]
MKDHVIICGLGNIGFRTFELLIQAHQHIAVISDTTHDEWRWQVEKAGAEFYAGDARNDTLLVQAGIQHAKAILAVTNHDMVNVSIAMEARNLNPNIRIIARMYDTDLGDHIAEAFGVHQVFSTSELAAPIFTDNIYRHAVLAQFNLNGKTYVVSEKFNTLDQTKLANVLTSTHNELNLPIHHLVVDLAETPKKRKNRFITFLNKFHYLRSPVFANFRRFLFVLICFIFTAAMILMWEMSLSFTDALYFVTTTVTTVGYGDFNFSHASPRMKVFGCLLMLSGAAALAILFSSITEIILSKKLPSLLGGRPVPKKNHIIIVGSGHVGHRIVSSLIENQIPVVIVENEAKGRYAEDINRRVALVDGYLRSSDTLIRANIERAQAIIVITNDDVENLSVSLVAKKINPKIACITQIFSSKLGDRLQSTLSLDKILSVSNIAAPYFAAAIFGEKILLALKWQDQLLFLSQKTDDDKTPTELYLTIDNKTYHDIRLQSIPLSPA